MSDVFRAYFDWFVLICFLNETDRDVSQRLVPSTRLIWPGSVDLLFDSPIDV